MNFIPLNEYASLSYVPFTHPNVKYKCLAPAIYCGDACGDVGCLGKDHKFGDCIYMDKKGEIK